MQATRMPKNQGWTRKEIVISYASRPRLVKPLDTGSENVNRPSTVFLVDQPWIFSIFPDLDRDPVMAIDSVTFLTIAQVI